ncbi:MAG: 4Fe-4S binding protein [Kiritimatiellia bacterium]|jgi:Ni,Fe-hydrogenase III small subunit/ferredoxin
MNSLLNTRLRQGYHTISYPAGPAPKLPERFTGRPAIQTNACRADCRVCAEACPVGAIQRTNGVVQIDMGRCIFCAKCRDACPAQAISFTPEHRLAANQRSDLLVSGNAPLSRSVVNDKIRKIFGRSLKLRQVSAGGCNACEADTNVLSTLAWDLGRFGIQFVAGPRHADGLLITGPVTQNMALALRKTYEAVSAPKIVIVVGACAISGGPYAGHPEVNNGAEPLLPVDLYIPGCPPHPLTILDGLLWLLGRLPDK